MKIILFLIAVYALIIYRSQKKNYSGHNIQGQSGISYLQDSLPGKEKEPGNWYYHTDSLHDKRDRLFAYPLASQYILLMK